MTDTISTAITYDEILEEEEYVTPIDEQIEDERVNVYGRGCNPLANWIRAAALSGFLAVNATGGTAAHGVYKVKLVPCQSAFEITGAVPLKSSNPCELMEGEKEATPVPAPTVAFQVETILRAFSLTMTQAARVLGVSRPTVYAWRKITENGKIEGANQERLLQVYKLAREWEERGLGPLGDRNLVPFEDDHLCLLDYLTGDDLDGAAVAKVKERLDLLATHPDDPKAAGHRKINWRESFRKQGFKESSQEEQDASFEDNLRRIRYE